MTTQTSNWRYVFDRPYPNDDAKRQIDVMFLTQVFSWFHRQILRYSGVNLSSLVFTFTLSCRQSDCYRLGAWQLNCDTMYILTSMYCSNRFFYCFYERLIYLVTMLLRNFYHFITIYRTMLCYEDDPRARSKVIK